MIYLQTPPPHFRLTAHPVITYRRLLNKPNQLTASLIKPPQSVLRYNHCNQDQYLSNAAQLHSKLLDFRVKKLREEVKSQSEIWINFTCWTSSQFILQEHLQWNLLNLYIKEHVNEQQSNLFIMFKHDRMQFVEFVNLY